MATNTATSFTNHTAPNSGSTAGPYAISFSYLDQSDVDVTVNGTLQALGVKYTFTSGTQITFTSGNEPPNGAAIVIKRDTNISAKKVDFQDGSVLTETDLDTNSDQLLFGLQEFTDKINGIEDGATADMTPAEILAIINSQNINAATITTSSGNVGGDSFLRSNTSDVFTGRTLTFEGPLPNSSIVNNTILRGRDLELQFGNNGLNESNISQAHTMEISAQRHGIMDNQGNFASINNINLGASNLGLPFGSTELNSNQIGHVARISLGRAYMTVAKSNPVYSTNELVMRASYPDGLMFYHPDTPTTGAEYYLSGSNMPQDATYGNSYEDNITEARNNADMRIIQGGILAKNKIEIGSSSVTGTLQISGTTGVTSIQTTLSNTDTALPTSGAVLDHFSNSGVLFEVVDDTTPQLGGDLDGLQKAITNVNRLTLQNGSSLLSQIMFTGSNASVGPKIRHTSTGNLAINRVYGGGGSFYDTFVFGPHVGPNTSNTPLVCTDTTWSGGFANIYQSLKQFYVTVATKDGSQHRYHGTGSSEGYVIQDFANKGFNVSGNPTPLGDAKQAPFLYLTAGITYRFDQSQSTNANHQLAFYLEADRTTQYTTGVTTVGTAGSSGAYVEIAVTDTTPVVLHYGSTTDAYMGNSVTTSTNVVNANNLNAGTIPDARFPATLPITTLQLSGVNVTSTAAEINVLDGISSTLTTTELNKLDGLTASTAELNLLDGKSIVTSIAGNATDTQLPSAQAVNERIIELVTEVGGFVPIANETSFPSTNPDVNDGAGTIISIKALGSNLTSNGSGVATITNGAGTGVTVTINGMANNDTIEAGKGILLETTTTLHTYNFHREIIDPSGVATADTLVSNFNERYYGPLSTNPATRPSGADRQDGDLYFNDSDNKMKVYNGTHASGTWDDVATPGNFFINTLSSSSGSGGGSATFNGTATRFTLSNPPLNAQQLLVSVNGVIQKPNSGTSPSEGFAIDGADIIFASAPTTSAPFFIITIGSSVNIGTPSNDTVGAAQIINGSISNAEISSSAAIAKSKLASLDIVNADVNASAAIARTKLANVDLVDDTSPQLGGDLDTNSFEILLDDNHAVKFGDGNDLQIYHTGTNTYVRNLTGDLYIQTNDGSGNAENAIDIHPNGAVELYYDNSKKFETTSGGATVSGSLIATANVEAQNNIHVADNKKFLAGNGNDLNIFHNGTRSEIQNNTGDLIIQASENNKLMLRAQTGESHFIGYHNAQVELYYDGVKKLETTSTGITVGNPNTSETNVVGTQVGFFAGAKSKYANATGLIQNQVSILDTDTSYAAGTGGALTFGGYKDSDSTTFYATIEGVKENSTIHNYAGSLKFYTRANNVANMNEAMVIDSSGNVLVATTSTTVNSSNFGIVLGSDGSSGMFKNIGGSGDVFRAGGNQGLANIFGDGDITNTNNSYGQASDETLKQDIVDAASQWNDIKNLRVRKFRFKDNPTGVLQIGVVAQEIEKVSAGLVQEDSEGIKSVKYSVLYMKAVKALQEAIAKIETLEAKVAALEAA
tara:strand:+ start:1402 stop:5985 length:4584 start_codon:yes stop_codon:yes gene_type:complete